MEFYLIFYDLTGGMQLLTVVVVPSMFLHLQVAVDMTTEGVEDTTVVTATAGAVEQGLVLAVKTTACF